MKNSIILTLALGSMHGLAMDRKQDISQQEEAKPKTTPHEIASMPDILSLVDEYTKASDVFEPTDTVIQLNRQVYCAAMSADESIMAIGDQEGYVHVINMGKGLVEQSWQAHPSRIDSITISRDGKRIITTNDQENVVCIWDTATGHTLHEIFAEDPSVTFFTPTFNNFDTQLLLATEGEVCMYDATTFVLIKTIPTLQQQATLGHALPITSLHCSPDGTKIVTVSPSEGAACIWDITTGKLLQKLRAYNPKVKHAIYAALFSPDNKSVVTMGYDKTVRLWNVQKGTIEQTLSQDHLIHEIGYNHDGTLMATAGAGNTIGIWRMPEGELIQTLKTEHKGNIVAVQVNPDGTKMISTGEDGMVRFYERTPRLGKALALSSPQVRESLLQKLSKLRHGRQNINILLPESDLKALDQDIQFLQENKSITIREAKRLEEEFNRWNQLVEDVDTILKDILQQLPKPTPDQSLIISHIHRWLKLKKSHDFIVKKVLKKLEHGKKAEEL